MMGPRTLERVNASGYGKNFAVLFQSQGSGYERTALLCGFHDHDSFAQSTDDTIADGKVPWFGRTAHGEL